MANQSGPAGEDYTAQWLVHSGYNILARNFHSRFGEVDIIAENSQYIIFVEVKTRKMGALVSALEAVTGQKQRKIILTAEKYLLEHPSSLQPRFDVAAVTTIRGEPVDLEYYPNAFSG